jgi:hypothetical protein
VQFTVFPACFQHVHRQLISRHRFLQSCIQTLSGNWESKQYMSLACVLCHDHSMFNVHNLLSRPPTCEFTTLWMIPSWKTTWSLMLLPNCTFHLLMLQIPWHWLMQFILRHAWETQIYRILCLSVHFIDTYLRTYLFCLLLPPPPANIRVCYKVHLTVVDMLLQFAPWFALNLIFINKVW